VGGIGWVGKLSKANKRKLGEGQNKVPKKILRSGLRRVK